MAAPALTRARAAGRSGGPLAGTSTLIRLILRRDRVTLLIWIGLFALFPLSFASSYAKLYPTADLIRATADEINHTPSELVMLGQVYAPTIGGLTAWRWNTAAAILFGVAAILTMIRHTRTDEEAGRRELLGGAGVGRQAALTAAFTVTAAACLLSGLLSAAGLAALGLPAGGALALGLGTGLTGCFFAALAGVTAQLAQSAGAARGLALVGLGLAFLVRVVGDAAAAAGAGWLIWLSPLGWLRSIRPFAGEVGWIFGLFILTIAALGAGAYALSARRDLGAGLITPRLGPAAAAPGLGSPLALAWRLHRGALLAWTLGFGVIGAVFGLVNKTAADQLAANPGAADYLSRLGGTSGASDGFFTLALLILVEVIGAYGVLAALRLRGEETALRAEPLLAGPTSRMRWAVSHLVLALLGPAAVLGAFGLLAGLTYGVSAGDVARQLPRVLGAALAYTPAVWVLVGITVALFGLRPRLSFLSWAALALFALLDLAAEFQLAPPALLSLSPYMHVPKLLAGQPSLWPLAGLTAAAALLTAAGLAAFQRRDSL